MTHSAPSPFATPELDLSGGAPCLDFVNEWRGAGADRDARAAYRRLLALGVQGGWLAASEARALDARAAARPRDTARLLGRIDATRRTLHALFSARAAGRPAPDALAALNETLPAALAGLRLEASGESCTWSWVPAGDDLAAPLARVVRSAAELLASDDAGRVRECDADTCRWLFLDRSRNRSRRWCTMASCGNRAKARRHYRRRRGEAGG